jgi:hypothetical protein
VASSKVITEHPGKEIKRRLHEMIDMLDAKPDEFIEFAIISIGTSEPEDDNIKAHTLVGGPPDYLLESLKTIVHETAVADPRFLAMVLKIAEGVEPNHLITMKTQGNA